MASFRHLSRELVLKSLFSEDFKETENLNTDEGVFSYILEEFGKLIPDTSFAESLYEGVRGHLIELNSFIEKYAPEWPLDKIARIDKIILQMAIFELLFAKGEHKVPPLVAVNESVELAKEFGQDKSSSFINGVLSSIIEDRIDEADLKKK